MLFLTPLFLAEVVGSPSRISSDSSKDSTPANMYIALKKKQVSDWLCANLRFCSTPYWLPTFPKPICFTNVFRRLKKEPQSRGTKYAGIGTTKSFNTAKGTWNHHNGLWRLQIDMKGSKFWHNSAKSMITLNSEDNCHGRTFRSCNTVLINAVSLFYSGKFQKSLHFLQSQSSYFGTILPALHDTSTS